MKNKSCAPLTFDLTRAQVKKIAAVRRSRRLRTASEVVRLAIAELSPLEVPSAEPVLRQISVRLAPQLRERLRSIARRKNLSIGELVRHALTILPA